MSSFVSSCTFNEWTRGSIQKRRTLERCSSLIRRPGIGGLLEEALCSSGRWETNWITWQLFRPGKPKVVSNQLADIAIGPQRRGVGAEEAGAVTAIERRRTAEARLAVFGDASSRPKENWPKNTHTHEKYGPIRGWITLHWSKAFLGGLRRTRGATILQSKQAWWPAAARHTNTSNLLFAWVFFSRHFLRARLTPAVGVLGRQHVSCPPDRQEAVIGYYSYWLYTSAAEAIGGFFFSCAGSTCSSWDVRGTFPIGNDGDVGDAGRIECRWRRPQLPVPVGLRSCYWFNFFPQPISRGGKECNSASITVVRRISSG